MTLYYYGAHMRGLTQAQAQSPQQAQSPTPTALYLRDKLFCTACASVIFSEQQVQQWVRLPRITHGNKTRATTRTSTEIIEFFTDSKKAHAACEACGKRV